MELEKMKCMLINQYSAHDMHFVHHKKRTDFWDFFRICLEPKVIKW